jgi:hypothetical protein
MSALLNNSVLVFVDALDPVCTALVHTDGPLHKN